MLRVVTLRRGLGRYVIAMVTQLALGSAGIISIKAKWIVHCVLQIEGIVLKIYLVERGYPLMIKTA